MGIDTSRAAVGAARRRGARAVQVDVFGAVPRPGTWATALLLDDNIGIGGDPHLLLQRVRQILAQRGRALVELVAPGLAAGHFEAQVEHGDGRGPRFPWARVDPDAIVEPAQRAGFGVDDVWCHHSRWFAQLTVVP
jgi:hypothetical protein